MDQETIAKGFYMSLCSRDEIERIFNVSSASDYLLKIRADATVNHVRIYRVFMRTMADAGENWCFNDYFDTKPLENYVEHLADEDYAEAKELTAGFVFCDKPNGQIEKTEFGNIITISESLRYFLYFMNLAILDHGDAEVPQAVRSAAIKIAIRTMLQSEALDFELDPRGEIPKQVHDNVQYHTNRQLEFIVGHEFAHYFLGHLNDANLIEDTYLSVREMGEKPHKFFSYAQQDELDADINAIERPIYTPDMRADLVNRALFFFVYLHIYQGVKDQISPSVGRAKSHPEPIDRFHHMYNHFKDSVELDEDNLKSLLELGDIYKESLVEDVALNFESYESYGSIYLAQWRGKVLIDRVDF
ncbi:hypothetical protein [Pseudidiomarina sp.]|uniref:hypothetical protein n=1 Tax=Pseudidiomarina sp. TaxID=2081707 RepID=UPI003A978915